MSHLTQEEKLKIESMDNAIAALLDVMGQVPSIFKNDIESKCRSLIFDLNCEIFDLKE